MGKRSTFERRERDFYPTPAAAVPPLLPHLRMDHFIEPCCGDGALIRALESHGKKCLWASDIQPQGGGWRLDAMDITDRDLPICPIVTNPPWHRPDLHQLIEHLSNMRPTWLLFDADWPHTRQSCDLMRRCHKIISVGRLKWIPDSPHTGKDNCAWYLFTHEEATDGTAFYGRTA